MYFTHNREQYIQSQAKYHSKDHEELPLNKYNKFKKTLQLVLVYLAGLPKRHNREVAVIVQNSLIMHLVVINCINRKNTTTYV